MCVKALNNIYLKWREYKKRGYYTFDEKYYIGIIAIQQ